MHARVLAWEHPFNTTLYNQAVGGSYQLAQSLFAQADGGLLGTGFDQSLLQYPVELANHQIVHRSILPVPESDLIYAVITDELGPGRRSRPAARLPAVRRSRAEDGDVREGLLLQAARDRPVVHRGPMQVFVIVGGVTRVIPLTGVTLPFVAYGGSSVVMNFVLLALCSSISDRARRPYSRA